MNYRGFDKDGKKYFVSVAGRHIVIDDGNKVLDLIINECYGHDKHGKPVFYGDVIKLPNKKFSFTFGGFNYTAKGELVKVPDFGVKWLNLNEKWLNFNAKWLRFNAIADIISESELQDRRLHYETD